MKPLMALTLLAAAIASAQSGALPETAGTLLDQAKAQAAPGKRAIFLIFGASWCGWCKKLDRFIESEGIRPIIQKYFVVTQVTVLEQAEKKSLNTPGGDELMKRVGATGDLIPYFAFLDSTGEVIVTANEPGKDGKPGGSIGHPDAPHEIDWFMVMLRKAVPAMTPEELTTIETYLRAKK